MVTQSNTLVKTTPKRTRRRLTIENAHDLHRNPYHSAGDIYMAMQWAQEHHAICAECANKKARRRRKLKWSECASGFDEFDWHPMQIDGRMAK